MGGSFVQGARRAARLALLALAAIPLRAEAAVEVPGTWRVLVLHGSDIYAPGSVAQVDALRSELSERAAPRLVEFRAEVLDALNFSSTHHEPELVALLEKKGLGRKLDLVMPMGEVALRFAERHRQNLWPGVPIVFFSVSQELVRDVAPGTTGITIDFDEAGTLALARSLQPDAQQLLLVAGASEYDRYWWPRLESAAKRNGGELKVEALFGKPIGAVMDRASGLPRRSIVLYTTVSRDGNGLALQPALVVEQIARVSRAPVYSTLESHVGRGVVGGSMESFAAHGRRAADVALRVLRGARPEDIPVERPSAPTPAVDWRQLRRHGLSERALPPRSSIRYRQPSILEEYGGYLVAAGLVLAVQTVLIAALMTQARRRRRAETEATRQRAELAHAARLSAVGELTASVAHEINQPLGAILSNAEAAELFLDADPPRLDRVRQILRDIQQEDQRASAVIREIRGLARKQPPEPKLLSLNDVIGDVMALVEADARRRAVQVETELAPRLPLVEGDRTQLQQVVLNLALNSLEALGPVGAGERRIRIRTHANGSGVELSVSDTGPGLGREDLPRLFESFFTTKAEGLGLGLSIVRSIVDAHGGRVTGENDPGRGATFRVQLPACREEPQARPV
jgi:signal transduction histidine kinase